MTVIGERTKAPMPDDPRNPHDTRTQREKLEAMARQKESPQEAAVAKHMLFKRYGRGGGGGEKKIESPPYSRARVVKTQDDVLDAFLRGDLAKSRKAQVPGDRRQSIRFAGSSPWSDDPEDQGGTELFSYNTVVARRSKSGDTVSINPRRYSTTTSKMMGRLQRKMSELGYEPTERTQSVHGVRNMGRWGGWGIPWAERSFDDILFTRHTRPKNRIRG